MMGRLQSQKRQKTEKAVGLNTRPLPISQSRGLSEKRKERGGEESGRDSGNGIGMRGSIRPISEKQSSWQAELKAIR